MDDDAYVLCPLLLVLDGWMDKGYYTTLEWVRTGCEGGGCS